MGKTILISSHILSELRALCNKICIIESGKEIYQGTINEALKRAKTGNRLEIRLRDRQEEACAYLEGKPNIDAVSVHDGHIAVDLADTVTEHSFVAEELIKGGFGLLGLREEEVLLEDAFLRLTGDLARSEASAETA